jgi:hypothetical protein
VDDAHVIKVLSENEELAQQAAALRLSLGSAREENQRLFSDNARLVRIIDSGDWGRARVAELIQAGDVNTSVFCESGHRFRALRG